MSALGDAIRFYREQRGWAQAELSRRANVEYSTINAIEAGTQQSIRSDRLKQLADALGVSVDALLRGEQRTEGLAAVPEVPSVQVPPVLAAAVRRYGKYLVAADWAEIAGFLQGLARKNARQPQAPGEPPDSGTGE